MITIQVVRRHCECCAPVVIILVNKPFANRLLENLRHFFVHFALISRLI